MKQQVFENITAEHFEALSGMVRSETGIEMRGNTGESGHNGYEIKWNYEGDTLTMQCTKAPWLFPEEVVMHGIEAALVNASDPGRTGIAAAPQVDTNDTGLEPVGSSPEGDIQKETV